MVGLGLVVEVFKGGFRGDFVSGFSLGFVV